MAANFTSPDYRTDIEGLRGIAVILVVLYHYLGSNDFNGYIGVDIFFVISGYLITKTIFSDINKNRFSLANFYERRVRRIIPALIVLLLFCAAMAYFLFLPSEMEPFAKSLIATIGLSSNVFFWLESGYFDMSAILKPLLHTWSLAVELQFYVLYPLLIWYICKYHANKILIILIALLIISFCANIIFVYIDNHDASFYLLPMRTWEFLVGSIVAFSKWPVIDNKRASQLAYAGFAFLILVLCIQYDKDQFPGVYALFPCLAAAFIIYAGEHGKGNIVSKVFSNNILAFFGKISYSLYLWHWPILVFGTYLLLGQATYLDKIIMAVLSILIAFISWIFIEKPWIENRKLYSRKVIIISLLITLPIIIIIAAYEWRSAYTKSGLDTSLLRYFVNNQIGDTYSSYPIKGLENHAFVFDDSKKASPPALALWGDSHALAISPALTRWAKKNQKNGILITGNTCLIPSAVDSNVPDELECSKNTDLALDYFKNTKTIDTIIIAQRWVGWMQLWLKKDMDVNSAAILREKSLKHIIRILRKAGKKVYVLAQVPEIVAAGSDVNIPSILARIKLYGLTTDLRPPLAEYMYQQRYMFPIWESLAKEFGEIVIFPHEYLCDQEKCAIQKGNVIFYHDDDHLSNAGAQSLTPMFDKALREN